MSRAHAREGNIPVLSLWGFLVVPLQGDIGDVQVERLRDEVLARLRQSEVSGLAIDVSGVWVLDSHICAVVSGLASAARLMGAEAVLCGLSPEAVLTLQAMDVRLEQVRTAVDVEEALESLGVHATLRAPERAARDDLFDDAAFFD